VEGCVVSVCDSACVCAKVVPQHAVASWGGHCLCGPPPVGAAVLCNPGQDGRARSANLLEHCGLSLMWVPPS